MPVQPDRERRQVPFVDLRRSHAPLTPALRRALDRTLADGHFVFGDPLQRFEREFARFLGVRYAVGVASGTDALHLALRAVGIGPGDEVLVPAMTFAATALAVLYTGATPIPVDVDETTALMNLEDAKRALTRRTKALVPVHLYGQPCAMEAILTFARRHGLRVIEDACQAHGALYGGRSVGTLGDIGCFSFYPSKNLGALGDGGMMVTRHRSTYETLLRLRNYGQPRKYVHATLGFNSRLDTLQAAFLQLKLPSLKTGNAARQQHAELYHALLSDTPIRFVGRSVHSVYHLFVVRTPRRNALRHYLSARGIETGIHYPVPISRQGFMKSAGIFRACPSAERLARDVCSLPMFPELTRAEVTRVAEAVRAFFR